MNNNHSKLTISALKVLATILAVGLMVHLIGQQELKQTFLNTHIFWLLHMYLMMVVLRLVDAVQFKLILDWAGVPVSLGRVLLAKCLGSLYSAILPGQLFGGGAKWADLSAATGQKATVFHAVVMNRMALLFPAMMLGTIALAWENPFPNTYLRAAATGIAAAVILAAASLYHPRTGTYLAALGLGIAARMPDRLRRPMEKVLRSLKHFHGFRPHHYLMLTGIAFFSRLLSVLMFAAAAYAVGLEVSLLTLAWCLAVVLLLQQLPLTMGSLGIREGALVFILGHYGVAAGEATALGLLLFSTTVLAAIVGAGYQMAISLGWVRWRRPDPSEHNAISDINSGSD